MRTLYLPLNKRRRLLLVAIAAMAFAGVFSIGAEISLSKEEAGQLKEEFEKQVQNIQAIGIFLNNMRIALTMFIPGFGIGVALFSAYSTGMVFNAIVQTSPQPLNIPPLVVFATPFGVMELFAYGLAMSQSGILVMALLRRLPMARFWKPILLELGIVAAVLLAGAYIEFYMIEAFKSEMEILPKI